MEKQKNETWYVLWINYVLMHKIYMCEPIYMYKIFMWTHAYDCILAILLTWESKPNHYVLYKLSRKQGVKIMVQGTIIVVSIA